MKISPNPCSNKLSRNMPFWNVLAYWAVTVPLAFAAIGCAGQTPLPAPLPPATTRVQSAPKSGANANPSTEVTHSKAGAIIPTGQDNSNLLLGNPSKAAKNENNLLLEREAHALSYNASGGGPNWVSWHLTESDLGKASRSNFLPDPLLPKALQIRPSDYTGSGYDRGHVCPSGDRTRDSEYNRQTFVMSNMLPQAAALNQQVWADLENYERYLVRDRHEELYVIAGGAGSAERIAGGKVNVPAVCWKIIVILPRDTNDLKRINKDTRVIAVSMPNRQRQEIADSKWTDWITSVKQLQETTGYDFLSALPDDVEKALEQKTDIGRSAARTTTATTVATTPAYREVPSPRRVASAPRAAAPRASVSSEPITASQPGEPVAGNAQVWVNTKSGIYHFPGARWYGKTKEGAFMSEAQAQSQGHRAAHNGQ